MRNDGCNLRQASALGFKNCDEAVGKTDFDLYSKSKASAIYENDMAVIKTGITHRAKEQVVIKGKDLVVFSVKRRILLKDGTYGILGVSIDVTSEDKLEEKLKASKVELEQKNKILREAVAQNEKTLERYLQFVEDQEHDVRTPISGIVSSAESLAFAREQGMSMQDELVGEMIECMQASSQQAQDYQESVIFDLYAGRFEGRSVFARFDLPDLTKRVFDFDSAAAKVKKLKYTYSYDEDIPNFLVGDAKRVYQCILDLLGNAIKFTENGKVEFSMKLLNCTEKQAVVRFRVSDTGIGIPEDKLDLIHQDFVKLKASNRGGVRGRGLGLSRVYRYATSVDGELNIKSTIGKGSTFSLVLPFGVSLDQTDD